MLRIFVLFCIGSLAAMSSAGAYSMPKSPKTSDRMIMVSTCYKLNARGKMLSDKITARYDDIMKYMDDDEIDDVFWYLLDRKQSFEQSRQVSQAIVYSAVIQNLFPEVEESFACKTY